MNDNNDSNKEAEGRVEGTIKAVAGLAKEVPIYPDAIQPVAKETGKALETVGKAVNAALLPIKGLVWGADRIETFVKTKVTTRLKDTPQENIQPPDLAVAGPALESLRYTGHKETLSDLYASLLATSMNSKTARNAHPGFVEIIRNMSSDEARVIKYLIINDNQPIISIFRVMPSDNSNVIVKRNISLIGDLSGCEHTNLMPAYFDNLIRLGLIEIIMATLAETGIYEQLINDTDVVNLMNKINELEGSTPEIKKGVVRMTDLGKLFSEACVINKS